MQESEVLDHVAKNGYVLPKKKAVRHAIFFSVSVKYSLSAF